MQLERIERHLPSIQFVEPTSADRDREQTTPRSRDGRSLLQRDLEWFAWGLEISIKIVGYASGLPLFFGKLEAYPTKDVQQMGPISSRSLATVSSSPRPLPCGTSVPSFDHRSTRRRLLPGKHKVASGICRSELCKWSNPRVASIHARLPSSHWATLNQHPDVERLTRLNPRERRTVCRGSDPTMTSRFELTANCQKTWPLLTNVNLLSPIRIRVKCRINWGPVLTRMASTWASEAASRTVVVRHVS